MISKKFEEKECKTITLYEVDSGIYFLIDEYDRVVYVGQTTQFFMRINQHKIDKHFRRICFIRCDKKNLNEKEKFFIAKYRPEYNKRVPTSCDSFYVFDVIRELIGLAVYSCFTTEKIINRCPFGTLRTTRAIRYLVENKIVRMEIVRGKGVRGTKTYWEIIDNGFGNKMEAIAQ